MQPRWRHLRLQCSEHTAQIREASVAAWLLEIGALQCHRAQMFYELLPRLQDGTILSYAAEQVTARPIPGILGKPRTMDTRHANVKKCAHW